MVRSILITSTQDLFSFSCSLISYFLFPDILFPVPWYLIFCSLISYFLFCFSWIFFLYFSLRLFGEIWIYSFQWCQGVSSKILYERIRNILNNLVNYDHCDTLKRNLVFVTNSDFPFPISFRPKLLDLRYFERWILLVYVWNININILFTPWSCKDKSFRKFVVLAKNQVLRLKDFRIYHNR